MTVDSVSSRPQDISALVARRTAEVPGERENDGDSDDRVQAVARQNTAPALKPEGVGSKIDTLA